MEPGVNHVRIQAWRWAASILIYPVTILPGLNAAILLISTLCVGLDCWTWEGALNNLAFGFPAVAGITALWFSTFVPIRRIAQSRWRFLLVTTGLMMSLIMECLFLKAGMENRAIRLPGAGVLQLWVFGGPLLAGSVNLSLLIWTATRLNRRPIPVRVHVVPPHHLTARQDLRPVRLEPFRPPVPTRWWVPSQNMANRVDRD